jgi:hypothetical protein
LEAAVKGAESIEEVARRHTALEPFAGKPGWHNGCCPICDDDDDSFYVFPDGAGGRFACYGCGLKGDASDLERLCGGDGELQALGATSPNGNGKLPESITAAELLGLKLPPIQWAIPDILPEGVALLAGRAKVGKSFLALGLGIAVAYGGEALGHIPVGRGRVLYIALDDTKRRLQKRLREMLAGRKAPDNLHISLSWPRLDKGGARDLDAWLSEHADTQLVVIDILQAIRPRTSANRSLYEVDYESLASLKPLVEKHAGVSILVVHHLNQGQSGDPLQLISGSEGLVGVVDGALVLKRERGKPDATLYVAGKDVEDEREYALKWDAQLKTWTLMGDASEFQMSDQRRAIRNALRGLDRPATAAEVAARLDEPYENVRKLLPKMADERIVRLHNVEGTTKYYTTDPNTPNDPNAQPDESAANGQVSGDVGSDGIVGMPVGASASEGQTNGLTDPNAHPNAEGAGVTETMKFVDSHNESEGPPVTVEQAERILASGQARVERAHAAYLEEPSGANLKWASRAILIACGKDPGRWEECAGEVLAALKGSMRDFSPEKEGFLR